MADKKKKTDFDEFEYWWAFDSDNALLTPDKWDVFDVFKTPLTYDDSMKIVSTEAKAKRKAYFTWYFDAMQIGKAEKERRIDLAERLCDEFIETIIWLYTFKEDAEIDKAKSEFNNDYLDALADYLKDGGKGISENAGTTLASHIEKFAAEVTESTTRHLDEDRFFSEGRAVLMAQNESAFTFNEQDYETALESGKTKKEWVAIIDEVTRPDHYDVDGTIIPIDEYFIVGGELMRFPLDDNASLEQTCNCRCSCKYT